MATGSTGLSVTSHLEVEVGLSHLFMTVCALPQVETRQSLEL